MCCSSGYWNLVQVHLCYLRAFSGFDIIVTIREIVRLNKTLIQNIQPQRYEKYSVYKKSRKYSGEYDR